MRLSSTDLNAFFDRLDDFARETAPYGYVGANKAIAQFLAKAREHLSGGVAQPPTIEEAVRDETERCALLCEMRADISRASAAKIRKDGSYTTRAIWPPFKLMTYVMPKWERNALLFEDVARAFDVVAGGIRAGWDPRKVAPHERSDEKITVVETGVDGDPTIRTHDV